MVKSYPGYVEDLHTLHHSDMHKNEFELMLKMYTQEQSILNLDLAIVGGIGGGPGAILNHHIDLSEEVLDDFFETKNLKKMDYLMEELDSAMHMGYDHLVETEEFDI